MNNPFLDWYHQRFGNAAAVADYFDADITEAAAEIGLKWSAVSHRVSYVKGKGNTCKINTNKSALLPGYKNSVGVYASVEESYGGADFPLITFKNKGGAGDTVVFNAAPLLWELFKEERGQLNAQARERRAREKAERDQRIARKQKAAIQKEQEEAKRRAANVAKELQHFSQLPRAASFVYTDKKQIAPIFDHIDARYGSDKYGNYMALQLQDIAGQPVGLQRIYDRKITKPDGSQTNKDFTWGMNKNGAHLVIGSLNAERIFVVEGFATGASVFLAAQSVKIDAAVIVSIDSGNMKKVVEEYQQKRPYLELELALDNDCWKQKEGKGNTGLLTGLDILSQYKTIKARAPRFDDIDASFQPTDFNDVHVYAGLKAVAKQIKGNKTRFYAFADPFENALKRLLYIQFNNQSLLKKELLKTATKGMQVGMPKYRPSDIVNLIRQRARDASIPADRISHKLISKQINRMFKAQVHEAQNFRSFSPRITDPKKRPDHITYKRFDKAEIDEEVLSYIEDLDGIVICRFPMGSGKTQRLIKPLMWQNNKTLFTAHRMSLIGAGVDALNKQPDTDDASASAEMQRQAMQYQSVVNYQEQNIRAMMPGVSKLACCINSILKPEFSPLLNNLDAVCIDEAAQTLRHVTAGGAIKYPVAVFDRWLEIMATTRENVILADADANDVLVEFCELGLKQRNEYQTTLYGEQATPQKIHIIDGMTDCSNINILYTDGDTAFMRAIADVKAGHRVLVASDSANTGEKLYTQLQTLYPEKKGLFISLDTKESEDVDKFTDAPNQQSELYDYLIYSPSISSGVSLENGHFDRHYGLFCGTVAPSDAIQMIRRDRKARQFILGLDTMNSNREESALNMWLGMILANDRQLDITIDPNVNGIVVNSGNFDFDRVRLDLIANENKAKNDFAKNLILSLYADGYHIDSLAASAEEKEQGEAEKKAASETLKAIDLMRHLEQTTPTDFEYEELEQRTALSRDDKARMNRWKIENMLMMPVDEDSVIFHRQGGLAKARLFELLNLSPERAAEYDAAEIANDVHPSQRKYLVKQRQALRDFFEIAGFDYRTGEGETTKEKLTAAIEHLTHDENIHMFNNWYSFGGYINPFSRNLKPLSRSKGILEALGLKAAARQLGRNDGQSETRIRYSIDRESWAKMAGIQQARTAADVTSFNIKELEASVIRSVSDNYIDTEEKTDHSQTASKPASSWYIAMKQAMENLRIPFEFAPKIITEVYRRGAQADSVPQHGVQRLISSIFNQLQGRKSTC